MQNWSSFLLSSRCCTVERLLSRWDRRRPILEEIYTWQIFSDCNPILAVCSCLIITIHRPFVRLIAQKQKEGVGSVIEKAGGRAETEARPRRAVIRIHGMSNAGWDTNTDASNLNEGKKYRPQRGIKLAG